MATLKDTLSKKIDALDKAGRYLPPNVADLLLMIADGVDSNTPADSVPVPAPSKPDPLPAPAPAKPATDDSKS